MAVQAPAEEQDTPKSWVAASMAGLGVVWMLQLVPSQRSAKARVALRLL